MKFAVGMALCQSLLFSLAVLGWAMRFMQRTALKSWWRASGLAKKISFADFLVADAETAVHRDWPNWILRQDFTGEFRRRDGESGGAKIKRLSSALIASLLQNVWLGLQGFFNTAVLTLPGCALMAFGWSFGWVVSFTKSYELFGIGQAVSVAGIFLLIAAMFYVPMAQARQAITGEWRAFYDFKAVWAVVRRRWAASVALAGFYSLLCIPVNAAKAFPMFIPSNTPLAENWTAAEALGRLTTFYLWWAVYALPAFLFLRWLAARIYAGGVRQCLVRGTLVAEDLRPRERAALGRLGLLPARVTADGSVVIKLLAWGGSLAGKLAAAFLMGLLWFSFIAQTYVAEFLKYHEFARGWLHHPLIQLPWFKWIPAHLGQLGGEVAIAAGVLFAALGVWLLRQLICSLRRRLTA